MCFNIFHVYRNTSCYLCESGLITSGWTKRNQGFRGSPGVSSRGVRCWREEKLPEGLKKVESAGKSCPFSGLQVSVSVSPLPAPVSTPQPQFTLSLPLLFFPSHAEAIYHHSSIVIDFIVTGFLGCQLSVFFFYVKQMFVNHHIFPLTSIAISEV